MFRSTTKAFSKCGPKIALTEGRILQEIQLVLFETKDSKMAHGIGLGARRTIVPKIGVLFCLVSIISA